MNQLLLLIYLLLCVVTFVFSKNVYGKTINPISIYSCVWGIDVLFYYSGLIEFYALSYKTIAVLYISHFSFLFGAMLGKICSRIKIKNKLIKRDDRKRRMALRSMTMLFCGISLIDLLPKFISYLSAYGMSFLQNTSTIYLTELYAEETDVLSFSAFLFVAVTFAGIYVSKYGAEKMVLIPVVLAFAQQLITGSRGGFICTILLFIAPFTLIQNNTSINLPIKNKKMMFVIMFSAIIMLTLITNARLSTSKYLYASEVLLNIPVFGGIIYTLIRYYSSGLGCLNCYLNNPIIMGYPKLLLRIPIIVMNKLGITHLDTSYHGITYNTPLSSNVLTLIGELFYDVGYWSFLVLIILSFFFSFTYIKVKKNESTFMITIYTVFFVIFGLSFFVYFGRSANVWYVLVFGGIASLVIDYKIKIRGR